MDREKTIVRVGDRVFMRNIIKIGIGALAVLATPFVVGEVSGNEEKEAYLAAFKDAQTILSNPGASQQDVKDALTALKNAKKKLHGKKPKAARRP